MLVVFFATYQICPSPPPPSSPLLLRRLHARACEDKCVWRVRVACGVWRVACGVCAHVCVVTRPARLLLYMYVQVNGAPSASSASSCEPHLCCARRLTWCFYRLAALRPSCVCLAHTPHAAHPAHHTPHATHSTPRTARCRPHACTRRRASSSSSLVTPFSSPLSSDPVSYHDPCLTMTRVFA